MEAAHSREARDIGFEIGPVEKAVIESVPLVLGSLKTLMEIIKAAGDLRKSGKQAGRPVADLRERWSTDLQKAGLAPERAEAIAKQFCDEYMTIIPS